jgi:hypothetical protein
LDSQDAIQLIRHGKLIYLYRVLDKLTREGVKALSGDEWKEAGKVLDLDMERGKKV